MTRSEDYRTLEDKLFDTFMAESTSDGEKFNAGALYFKRTGKLIQMHVKTPDPNARRNEFVHPGVVDFEEILRRAERWYNDQTYARRAAAQNEVRAQARAQAEVRARREKWQSVKARVAARRAATNTRDYTERGWYRNAAGQWIDLDGRAHDRYGRYTKRVGTD